MSDSHGGGGGGLPLLGAITNVEHKVHGSGVHISLRPYLIAFAAVNFAFLIFAPLQVLRNFAFLGFFAPLWAPVILAREAFNQWVIYKRSEFIGSQNTVLLELRMPRDVKKTPLAMEAIFANLHITSGEGNNYAKYWQGKVRTWFSFEIVSIGGRVRFFVWTRAGLRRGVESFFYAQYPDMEIVEAEDYSRLFDPSAHENSMFGEEFVHTKPDPFPIKTYVDYKLDNAGAKPEEVVDPMAQMLELFGSIGPKEQLWFQMVIRATKNEKFSHKGPKYTWREEATEQIAKIRQDTAGQSTYVDPITGIDVPTKGLSLSKGQNDVINAIERNIAKQGFDVGMRAIYTAPKEAYQGTMVGFVLGTMLKPFSSEATNSFKPSAKFDAKFNDYPWEDRGGHHKEHAHHEIVEYYRRRAFYHPPYIGEWMVMSTEELATLFHVPSAAINTPSLPRIQSATAGAPSNLPT